MSISVSLEESLGLRIPPIAVTFVDEPPPGVPRFDGAVPAGCSFWERAAAGAFVTGTADHELCAIGVHTHSLAGASAQHGSELRTALKVMADLDYVREEDVAAIPTMARSVRHVVYAPLAQAPLAPDVVLLFAHARYSLVLSEAVQQVEAGTPPAMGRPACAAIPQVMKSGRAAMSLGCCGARAYLDVMTDDVAMWALPGERIAAYAERVSVLARANAVLGQFHTLRRSRVEQGGRPTMADSLADIGAR